MTIQQRNDLIDEALIAYKVCHDRHFPNGRSLTDEEWEAYISEMDTISAKYKDSNISELSARLCMNFLDDTEMVHKMWLQKEKKC